MKKMVMGFEYGTSEIKSLIATSRRPNMKTKHEKTRKDKKKDFRAALDRYPRRCYQKDASRNAPRRSHAQRKTGAAAVDSPPKTNHEHIII